MSKKFKQTLSAEIVEHQGIKNLAYSSPTNYYHLLERAPLGKYSVTIENKKSQRSGGQNRYWHKCCFPVIAELTGHTITEAKEICVKMFILPKIVEVKGKEYEIRRGTSELSVSEGVEFTDSVRNLAVELNGYIPVPCESGFFCGRRECDICSKKMNEEEHAQEDYPQESNEVKGF